MKTKSNMTVKDKEKKTLPFGTYEKALLRFWQFNKLNIYPTYLFKKL